MDIEELRTFVEVADAGGVSAVAIRLGVSKSIVSRRLLRLEVHHTGMLRREAVTISKDGRGIRAALLVPYAARRLVNRGRGP